MYLLKNVGIPEYNLGGNIDFLVDYFKNQGLPYAIYARIHNQNVIPKFDCLSGNEFKPIKTPMSEGYHPEIDYTNIYIEEDSTKYRSIIACCIWITVLGRFDIVYATSVMSRFNMLPRKGHLKAAKIILAYFKIFPKERIIVDKNIQTILFIPLKIIPSGRASI
jgi:hypothetical protein